VIAWWDERERVLEWLAGNGAAELPAFSESIAPALAAFAAYLRGSLRDDLYQYADWLSRR
jgi:hypothetical protein